MVGVESVISPQPVIKDVQTLKANLKEQEKRARSTEVEEVVPSSIVPPTAPTDEQRKRRKVSNPAESNGRDAEEPILDGPLPSNPKEGQPTPADDKVLSSGTHPTPSPNKPDDSSAPVVDSPVKDTKPTGSHTSAPADTNKTEPSLVSTASEGTVKPDASGDHLKKTEETCASEAEEPKEVEGVPNGTEADAPTESDSIEQVTKSA